MIEIPDNYLCPITLQIFLNPYTAEDENNYEFDEISHWLEINNISPMTGEMMGYNLVKNYSLINEIEDYINKNSNFKNEQYKKDFHFYENKVIHNLKNKKFHNILKYKNIDLNKIIPFLKDLMKVDEYAIHIINFSNYEKANCGKGSKLIHYISKFSSLKVLKYAIDKNMDLEAEDNQGWRPLHIVCYNGDIEKIKFLLNSGKVDKNVKIKNMSIYDILSRLRINF